MNTLRLTRSPQLAARTRCVQRQREARQPAASRSWCTAARGGRSWHGEKENTPYMSSLWQRPSTQCAERKRGPLSWWERQPRHGGKRHQDREDVTWHWWPARTHRARDSCRAAPPCPTVRPARGTRPRPPGARGRQRVHAQHHRLKQVGDQVHALVLPTRREPVASSRATSVENAGHTAVKREKRRAMRGVVVAGPKAARTGGSARGPARRGRCAAPA